MSSLVARINFLEIEEGVLVFDLILRIVGLTRHERGKQEKKT